MFLTIGIPTYNGATYISETLESVLSQIELCPGVEVLVLDNASTDSTAELALTAGSGKDNFRFVRQNRTVHVSKNIQSLATFATGEYLWILADDDVLTRDALPNVIGALKRFRPSLLLTGFNDVDQNLVPLDPGKPQLVSDQVFHDADLALLSSEFRFGLISTIVVNRVDFARESLNAEGIPSGFDFLYVIPKVMLCGSVVLLSGSQVLFRKYRKRWIIRDDYALTFENYYVVIPSVFARLENSGFRKRTLRILRRRNMSSFSRNVLIGKAKGLKFNRVMVRELMAVNYRDPFFWLQLPVVYVPGPLLRKLKTLLDSRRSN